MTFTIAGEEASLFMGGSQKVLKNEHTSDVETSRPLLLLQSSSVVAFEPQRIIENCPISIVIVWAGAASGQLLFQCCRCRQGFFEGEKGSLPRSLSLIFQQARCIFLSGFSVHRVHFNLRILNYEYVLL